VGRIMGLVEYFTRQGLEVRRGKASLDSDRIIDEYRERLSSLERESNEADYETRKIDKTIRLSDRIHTSFFPEFRLGIVKMLYLD